MKVVARVTAGLLGLLGVAAIVLALRPAEGGEPVSTAVGPHQAALPTAPPLPDPSEAAAPAPPELATCENADLGYVLRYPADWVVATDDPVRPCRFFSRTAIGPPPPGNEFPVAEIRVLQARVPYAELLDQLADSSFEETSRRSATVAGAAATLIRYVHPEDPAGGGYVCIIDRGDDAALYVEARDADSPDPASTARVLDAMVRSMVPA